MSFWREHGLAAAAGGSLSSSNCSTTIDPQGHAGSCCDRRWHDCTEQGLQGLTPSQWSITQETFATLERGIQALNPHAANMHTMCNGHKSCMNMGRNVHTCKHVWNTEAQCNYRADSDCKQSLWNVWFLPNQHATLLHDKHVIQKHTSNMALSLYVSHCIRRKTHSPSDTGNICLKRSPLNPYY